MIRHIAIVFAFAVLAAWFSWGIYTSSNEIHAKAEETIILLQQKRASVFTMIRAARERTFLLLEMYASDDVFHIDELRMVMVHEAERFIKARAQLEQSELSKEDAESLNKAMELVQVNVPRQRLAAEWMLQGRKDEAYELLFDELIPVQSKILGELSVILSGLEETSSRELAALGALHDEHVSKILWLNGLILFAILLAFSYFIVNTKRNERRLQSLVDERTGELEAANAKVRSLFENTSDAIVTVDLSQNIQMFNPAAELLFGYPFSEVYGKPLNILIPSGPRQRHEHYVKGFVDDSTKSAEIMSERPEVMGRRKDGETFPAEVSICKFEVAGELYLTAFVRDITERREAEKSMRQMAVTDGLTGLSNRHYFDESLKEVLSYQRRTEGFSFALMLVDLDGFKSVNDRYGHPAGDALLKHVASLLRESVREMDVVCRWGGDEFAILLKDPEQCSNVEDVAAKLIEKIRQPYTINDEVVSVGASIGVACFSSPPVDAETVVREADKQLYQAKTAGKNTCRAYQG